MWAHSYIEDVLKGGAEKSMRFMADVLSEPVKVRAADTNLDDCMRFLAEALISARAQMKVTQRQELVAAVRESILRYSDDYGHVIRNVERLYDQVLLEMAILHLTTAFEVFREDAMITAVARDPSSLKRLVPALEVRLRMRGRDLDKLVAIKKSGYECEKDEAIVRVAVDTYSIFNSDSVSELCRHLLQTDSVLIEPEDRQHYDYVMQLRHIIAHCNCIADAKFVKFVQNTARCVPRCSKVKLQWHDVAAHVKFIDQTAASIRDA